MPLGSVAAPSKLGLIYYVPDKIMWYDEPGFAKFRVFFQIYGLAAAPVDRTGTIKLPLRMKSLFPLPSMRSFTKTYKELCEARAEELLKRADKLDVPIFIMWSGGVDSTCVLVSLLKAATTSQKERMTVLLSDDSIVEYADFYHTHIYGKLHQRSALEFPKLLDQGLLISGEFNDQLFGSDIISYAIQDVGFDTIAGPYDRRTIARIFWRMKPETAQFYVGLFDRLREVSPIPLKSNFDLLWWINFALKWQTVYMRVLCHGNKFISREDLYAPFFNTADFQLWSMNNLDKRIKDNWCNYKWPAKEIIYDFTKDEHYRDNKKKHGSLYFLAKDFQRINFFLDERFVFSENINLSDFYQEDNDFI